MRVDHNRPSHGVFPAFKRGFGSGFAAFARSQGTHGVVGNGDEGSASAAVLPSDRLE